MSPEVRPLAVTVSAHQVALSDLREDHFGVTGRSGSYIEQLLLSGSVVPVQHPWRVLHTAVFTWCILEFANHCCNLSLPITILGCLLSICVRMIRTPALRAFYARNSHTDSLS